MSHGSTRDRRLGWGWETLQPVRRSDRRRLKPSLLALEDRRLLTAFFTVTSAADTLTAGSPTSGTLRWAVEQAEAIPDPSIIDFNLGSTPQTITLSQGVLALSNTSGSITIEGPTAGVTISGGGTSGVFQVNPGATATLSGLTITDGNAGDGGGVLNETTATLTLDDCTISGNSAATNGGGVYNKGTATLDDCTISGNSAATYGGGVYNEGTVTLTDCTVSGNSAFYEGGGIYNVGTATLNDSMISGSTARYGGGMFNSGTATLDGSTISGNSAASEAGGVFNEMTLTLNGSTISGNSAGFKGGGAYNRGTATLIDCLISGNFAKYGGGVFNFGTETLTLDNCTIIGNSALNGGRIYNYPVAALDLTACTIVGNSAASGGGGVYNAAAATLTDTIVVDNSGSDLSGTVSGSNNLIGTGGTGGLSATNNLLNVADPLLSPLGNYGGPTQTIALLPGSPAMGGGTAVSGITTDQRGVNRPSTGDDIGAFQSQGFTLTPVIGSTPQSAPVSTAFANPLAVTVTANDSLEPVAGGVITFSAPSTGASANLSSETAVIGSNGLASVTATANAVFGSYTVTASAAGAAAPATFALDNLLIMFGFSSVSDPSITYGTASVTLTGTLADNSLTPKGETVSVSLNGVERQASIGGDGTFSTTFDTAGLGVAGSPYTISYVYTTDGIFPSSSTTKTLTVTRVTLMPVITVSPKVYDGTTTATLTSETLIGVIGGDVVSLTGGPASFANKNVGTDQMVTVTGLSLNGAAAGNYQLDSTTATTMATITPATVSVTGITAANKVYDATTAATLNFNAAVLVGVLAGDTVTLDTIGATGTFASPNAGSNIVVTVSGLTLGGPQASDYTLTRQPTTTASIQPAIAAIALTASAGSAVFGQPVTFVASVTSSAATPGGTVTFSENGNAVATVPLDGSGKATLTTASLALGTQAITASFDGGSDFVGTQSASVSVSVTRAATQIVLVPHSVFKKKRLISLRLTAMIEPVAPAGGIPTGELKLELLVKQKKRITKKTLAMSGVIGGEATLTLNPNQVLNKAITIVYSGDLDFGTSTASSTLTQNSLKTL